MERHINNHALTDKVFSDKGGENGFPCGILRQFVGDGEFGSRKLRVLPAFGLLNGIPEFGMVRTPGRGGGGSQNHSLSHTAFAGVVVSQSGTLIKHQ